jgi:hypothetical protein
VFYPQISSTISIGEGTGQDISQGKYRSEFITSVETNMNFKLKLLEFASKLGISQPMISVHNSLNLGDNHIPELHVSNDLQRLKLKKEDRNGHVILTLLPGNNPLNTFTLAMSFKLKGYSPIILYNDGMLPIKPSVRYYTNNNVVMELQRYKIKIFAEEFGISPVSIHDVLGENYSSSIRDDIDQIKSFHYGEIDLSPFAVASTRKYLQKYTLNEKNDETIDTYRGFIEGGAIIADATQQIINEYDVAAAIITEPAYIHGGVPAEVCANNKVNAYTRNSGYQYGKMQFGRATNRYSNPSFANEEIVQKVLNSRLSALQKGRIREIMKHRETGDILGRHFTTNNESSVDSSKDCIVGIFSHLLWDAALAPQQAIYQNIFNWLEDTIEVGSQMKETHFVIKSHPAELSIGTNQRVGDWIDAEYDSLPSNFTFLPPDTDVNTYSLIRDLDAGIVYASTVGLEMAYNGVPVVTGGYPPYHGFGLTYDPSTQAEFRNKVERIDQLECSKPMIKKAKRFAYLLFVSKAFDYPYSSIDLGQHAYVSREKLLTNEIINEITSKILNGEEVIKKY